MSKRAGIISSVVLWLAWLTMGAAAWALAWLAWKGFYCITHH